MNRCRDHMLIIGGGIVGMTLAYTLRKRYSDLKITLLEKEADVGLHQTGHNSGVLHSGIYYPEGSLKFELCRKGAPTLLAYCREHGVTHRKVGKAIVAQNDSQATVLDVFLKRSERLGLQNLEIISSPELLKSRFGVEGFRALWIPEIYLIDFRGLVDKLKRQLESLGVSILTHRRIQTIERRKKSVRLQTERNTYEGSYAVNCAGLYSDTIAVKAGLKPGMRIVPFRGEYFELGGQWPSVIKNLIYPVPDPRYPFLGIHLSPTLDGRVTVGPNAVLALAREGYLKSDINLPELCGNLLFPGFWRMAAKNFKTAVREWGKSQSKTTFLKELRTFLPTAEPGDLFPGGSGVRAQAVDRKGNLLQDFVYLKQPGFLHVLNAPSPAATASFAIADRLADMIQSDHQA